MTPMHRTLHQAAQRDRESERRWSTVKSVVVVSLGAALFWAALWTAWVLS